LTLPTNVFFLAAQILGRPNKLAQGEVFQFMISKKANSNKIDMMFNLNDDPFEMNNLIGKNGMSASEEVGRKAVSLLFQYFLTVLPGPGKQAAEPE